MSASKRSCCIHGAEEQAEELLSRIMLGLFYFLFEIVLG